MADHQSPSADQALDELQSRYTELAALAGSLAHEIKNPLSVIRMNMDLLAEDFADCQSPRERRMANKVEVVRKQCTRLETLLDDFLRFARLQRLDLRAASFNDVIYRVLDLYEPQCAQQGVDVKRYLDPDLPSILLESQTLQAALINLVKNALEAMPEGGQFVARTRPTRMGVSLDLIDTGCGMDDETA